jgi:hypothetical protein
MRGVVFVLMCWAFAGCATPEMRAERLSEARSACSGYGYRADSEAHARCVQDEVERKRSAPGNAMRGLADSIKQRADRSREREPRPTHVTCTNLGIVTECVSR